MRKLTYSLLLVGLCLQVIFVTTNLKRRHPRTPNLHPSSPAPKPASKPVVAHWSARPFPANQVNLIAMGDWGSAGRKEKEVAKGLAEYVAKSGTQFNGLLSLGDNFYVKLKDADDYQFQTVFEDMFDSKRINFPFYGAGKSRLRKRQSQDRNGLCRQASRFALEDARAWYRIDLPAEEPLVTVLMLDSNKPQISAEDWLAQLQLDRRPARRSPGGTSGPITSPSSALSNGEHGDNGVLQVHWGPIFKKYKLDFYVCGHDHDLQELQMPDWSNDVRLSWRRRQKTHQNAPRHTRAHSREASMVSRTSIFSPIRRSAIHQRRKWPNRPSNRPYARRQSELVIKGGNDKATNQPLKVLLGLESGC